MKIEMFHKQEIAARQLETALTLFFAGGDLFSVITLAGAAEEIFNQLLVRKAGRRHLSFRSVLDLLRPAKGRRGDGGTWQETDLQVHMDLRQEALFLLGRAIDGYRKLTGELSADMKRFDDTFGGCCPSGREIET